MNTVTSVQTEDLLVGTGQTVDENTQYSAYYIGWNPKGVIFDQSIKEGKLIAPIPAQGLIQGWNEGTKGMKLGGVREITIPSDKAYGEKGGGDKIPPNTPIKFLVLAIETPEQLQPSEELLKLNGYPQ
jgi:FKBP-type peptidyl-prolyl cis-trans isomerase